MGQTFWDKQSFGLTIAKHTAPNVAFPLLLMSLMSLVLHKPEIRAFALYSVAPWTAVASIIIVSYWIITGRAGRLPSPPNFLRHVLPGALVWALVFGLASLVLKFVLVGGWLPVAFLDGGISAGIVALITGIGLTKQAHKAAAKGDY